MFSIRIFNNLVIALCPYQILDLIQYNNLMGIIHIDLWTANLIKYFVLMVKPSNLICSLNTRPDTTLSSFSCLRRDSNSPLYDIQYRY